MFVNKTHLPQRLTSAHYSSAELHQRELEQMFLPAWHCIGTLADVPRDGDFITTELYDHPIICWRVGGEVQTFLNVCCHRFCTLTNEPSGRFAERMKCQYHGWEYDAEGNPRRIPDAPSFRPLVKGQLKLKQYRTETVGKLIFVSLAEQGPDLASYLGEPLYGLCQQWFGDDHNYTHTFDDVIDCNWKVVVENVLESYHIETLHTKTFVKFPEAEYCTHRFFEHGDECVMDYSHLGHKRFEEWFISKLAGVDPAYKWHHLIRYPNLVVAHSCLVTYVQQVIPLGPEKCRNVFRVFHYPGEPGRLRTWLANRLLHVGAPRFVGKVLAEDASIYPQVQAGATSFDLPGQGLVSAREERIFPFQEFVLQATADDTGGETESAERAPSNPAGNPQMAERDCPASEDHAPGPTQAECQ